MFNRLSRPASQYCQLENETPTNTLLIFLLTIVSISSRSSALLLLLAFHSESCSHRRVSPRRFLTCTMGWRAGFARGFSSGGDQTRIRNLSSFLLTKKETTRFGPNRPAADMEEMEIFVLW